MTTRADYRRVRDELSPLPTGITPPPRWVDPAPAELTEAAERLADALGVEFTGWQREVLTAHLAAYREAQ